MRKQLTMIAVCIATLLVSPALRAASSGKCGATATWKLDAAGNLVINGRGKMYDYNGRNETPWNRSKVKTATISAGITEIGIATFRDCKNMTSVTIPNTVTIINGGAFNNCRSLTSVIIPNSVIAIGNGAFSESGLTSIEIPNSVCEIRREAFRGCDKLTDVKIGRSLYAIGKGTFHCRNLSRIVVDKENKTFDSRNDCNALIETATNTLVYGCKNTVIPNSVTKIGDGAFSYRNGVTTIFIPASVSAIGKGPFAGCSDLTSIVVDKENKTFDSRNDCNALIETATNTLVHGCRSTIIPNTVTSIGYGAFDSCEGLTNIVIPNSVTSIGDYAFQWCSDLKSVTIGASVKEIGRDAFEYCGKIEEIVMLATVPPTCVNEVFDNDVKKKCKLKLGSGSAEYFRSAPVWSEFLNTMRLN